MRPRPSTKLVAHEVGQDAVLVGGPTGDGADLVERAGVEQGVDPLAHGELAAPVLTLDLVGAAHPDRHGLPAAQLRDLGLPGAPAVVPHGRRW